MNLKNVKRINLLFLCSVLLSVAAEIFVSIIATNSIKIPLLINMLISQCLILIPGLFYLFLNKSKDSSVLPFGKLKVTTVIMLIIYTELCMPITSFANLFSQLFTKNEVLGLSGDILDLPFVMVLLMVGIIGPFSEEFVFRGIIFRGLRKSTGRIVASVLTSALFFGLMHLNLNQFCYAILLGIIFATTDETLDGLWPSVIMHCIINSQNVVMLYLADFMAKFSGQDISSAYETNVSKNMIFVMTIMFAGVALVTTTLAGLLLYGMCLNEGKVDKFKNFIKKPESKEKVITTAGIIAIALCAFIIFGLEPLIKIMKSLG